MPPKANNNRKAVVVCARHVVNRSSKRMRASTHIYKHTYSRNRGFLPPGFFKNFFIILIILTISN